MSEYKTKMVNGVEVPLTKEEIKLLKRRDFKYAEKARINKIADIKDEAKRRIELIAPLHNQLNMSAKALELVFAGTQRALTADEQMEMSELQSAWAKIKDIRAVSAKERAKIDAGQDVDLDKINWPE